MKIQTLVFTLVMSCVSSLSFNVSMNQSAVAQTATQRQKLKELRIPLVLPSYQPSGYRLTKFTLEKLKPSDQKYKPDDPFKNYNYQANYQGPNGCVYYVKRQFPIGDETERRDHDINTQLFGKAIITEDFTLNPRTINFVGSLPNSDFMVNFDGRCNSSKFSLEEGKKIVKSLRIVR